jgi:hypothetical protein
MAAMHPVERPQRQGCALLQTILAQREESHR